MPKPCGKCGTCTRCKAQKVKVETFNKKKDKQQKKIGEAIQNG